MKVRIKGLWYNVLVNCKAEGNFVIPKVVNELKLLWKKKNELYNIKNLEKQTFEYDNGTIKRKINHLKTFINGKKLNNDFDIFAL